MTTCSEYETFLWMDIHGELDIDHRRSWEEHLQTCTACRKEKVILTQIITQIRKTSTPPPVADSALKAAIEQIGHLFVRLNEPTSKARSYRSPLIRFAPIAALCTLFLFIGLHQFKADVSTTSSTNVTMIKILSDLPKEDEEVIENMDLLSDFDTIEEIVKAIDPEDDLPGPENGTQENPEDGEARAHG